MKDKFTFHSFLSQLFIFLFGGIFLVMFIFLLRNRPLLEPDNDQDRQDHSYRHYSRTVEEVTDGRPGPRSSFSLIAGRGVDDIFMPATIKFDSFSVDGQPFPDEEEFSPEKSGRRSIEVTGGGRDDILMIGLYDIMRDGGFARSENLKVTPSGQFKEGVVGVNLSLPSGIRNQKFQLPVLLEGEIINSYSNNYSYRLSPDGALELLAFYGREEEPYVSYLIRRASPASITISDYQSGWLEKEFKDIPDGILNVLNSARKSSDSIKLTAVAFILNTYFAYQSGAEEVVKPAGKTWNYYLGKKIKEERKFSADCDVLSAFAFIYCKFLDIHPVFVVGYFGLPKHLTEADDSRLHASLYLSGENGPFFFEPTFFASLPETLSPEEISGFTATSPQIDYFLPAKDLLYRLEEEGEGNFEERLNQIWADVEDIEEKQKKEEIWLALDPQLIYRVILAITFFALIMLLAVASRKIKK